MVDAASLKITARKKTRIGAENTLIVSFRLWAWPEAFPSAYSFLLSKGFVSLLSTAMHRTISSPYASADIVYPASGVEKLFSSRTQIKLKHSPAAEPICAEALFREMAS